MRTHTIYSTDNPELNNQDENKAKIAIDRTPDA
jgi:hypothetical protein